MDLCKGVMEDVVAVVVAAAFVVVVVVVVVVALNDGDGWKRSFLMVWWVAKSATIVRRKYLFYC